MSGLGAHPAHDARLRGTAASVANEILNVIGQDPDGLLDVIAVRGYAVAQMRLVADSLSKELGLPETIEFDLVLDQMGRHGGAIAGFAARTPGKIPPGHSPNMLLLNVLPRGAEMHAITRGSEMFNHIKRALRSNADVLIHEITHMLDHYRGGEFMAGKAPPYAEIPQEDRARYEEAYINNPGEFNAMFQQGIFELQDWFEHHTTPLQRKKVMRSFDDFKEHADRTLGIAMLRRAVVGKWRKKLDARLYQTWEHWKEGGA